MRQSIFAILILSTLCLQTQSTEFQSTGLANLCTGNIVYDETAINSILGSPQDFSYLSYTIQICANLLEQVVQNPQSNRNGVVGDENDIVLYGQYEYTVNDAEKTKCYLCTNNVYQQTAGTLYKAIIGPVPDFYVASDPETSPKADSTWETQDVDCGDGQFVSLDVSGAFKCVGCANGQQEFYDEYSIARTTGTGVKHGKCCVNGHHKVCQQLLNSYKTKCSDDASDKGHAANRECSA